MPARWTGSSGGCATSSGEDTPVIATGGLAPALVPFVQETIEEVDDLLTLTGLRLIWERNAPEARVEPPPPFG